MLREVTVILSTTELQKNHKNDINSWNLRILVYSSIFHKIHKVRTGLEHMRVSNKWQNFISGETIRICHANDSWENTLMENHADDFCSLTFLTKPPKAMMCHNKAQYRAEEPNKHAPRRASISVPAIAPLPQSITFVSIDLRDVNMLKITTFNVCSLRNQVWSLFAILQGSTDQRHTYDSKISNCLHASVSWFLNWEPRLQIKHL